jgi:hypothetical protein
VSTADQIQSLVKDIEAIVEKSRNINLRNHNPGAPTTGNIARVTLERLLD